MSIWEIILVGVGLSMDAAAVSISNTLCLRKIKVRDVLMMCIAFGVFQCLMPIIGYFGASLFKDYIMVYDHWIALLLLLFIGGKMVYETLRHSGEADACEVNFRLTIKLVAVQAIATSIDALAVGISFALLEVDIVLAIVIIGITTFVLSFLAVFIGHFMGGLLEKYAGILGGIILLLIGIKIVIEHTL